MSTIRLTPGDVDVLRFVGRHRFATVPQVARWAGRSEKKIYPRLCGLRAHELVEFRRPLIERGVYLATRAGLVAAGLSLPPARVEIATFTHDRLVADLAVDLERAGVEVVTEREMRHTDESPESIEDGRPRYAVVLGSGGRHYPDLAVVLASGRFEAVEVELSPKNRARRERILGGYARARHIETVTYHVGTAQIGDLVARSAVALGIGDLVEVRPLTMGVAACTRPRGSPVLRTGGFAAPWRGGPVGPDCSPPCPSPCSCSKRWCWWRRASVAPLST